MRSYWRWAGRSEPACGFQRFCVSSRPASRYLDDTERELRGLMIGKRCGCLWARRWRGTGGDDVHAGRFGVRRRPGHGPGYH